jgi:hypothetical protein
MIGALTKKALQCKAVKGSMELKVLGVHGVHYFY